MKKSVSFKNNELDKTLLEYSATKMNFSVYVKQLILKDMERSQNGYTEDVMISPERYTTEINNNENLDIEW